MVTPLPTPVDTQQLDPTRIVDIDLGAPSTKRALRTMAAEWATRPPFYVVTEAHTLVICARHADVMELYRDDDRFSTAVPRQPGYEMFDKFFGVRVLAQMDGEAHARVRRLMTPAFSPKSVKQLATNIDRAVNRMLDEIDTGADPQFDLMQDFGNRLIVEVLLTEMLGLSPDQTATFVRTHRAIPLITYTRAGQQYPDEVVEAFAAARQMIDEIIAERRSDPGDDMISELIQARDGTDRLDDTELFDQIFTVCAGAMSGTSGAMSGVLYTLMSNPEVIATLVEEPELIPGAIEECQRWHSGYLTFPRFAQRDTEIGGTPILAGMVVRACPAAAHMDPTVYPEPLTFDVDRKPKTVAFGAGPHLCIGQRLAKLAMERAITLLLDRYPTISFADPEYVPDYGGSVGEMRIASMPVVRAG